MDWRDTLRPASFRGVPFKVSTSNTGVGRRTVRHDFPQRDETYVEDLGRKPRRFTLEAYIVGPDYTTGRDALLAACEEEGPGELVHPYLGTQTVQVNTCDISESQADGGLARFALEFEQSFEPIYPATTADPTTALDSTAAALTDAAGADLEDKLDVLHAPQFLADNAAAQVRQFTDRMNAVLAPITSTVEAITDLKHSIDGLYLDATALVRTPGELFASAKNAVSLLGALPDLGAGGLANSAARYRSLRTLADFGKTRAAISETTPTREQEARNQAAIDAAFRCAALAEAARAAGDVVSNANAGAFVVGVYDSLDALLELRDDLAEALDYEAEVTTSDDVFLALVKLRAAMVATVPGEASDLNRLVTYTPVVTEPALVLAHRLYRDATRADEIATRNAVRNPLAIPGDRPLQVLSDA